MKVTALFFVLASLVASAPTKRDDAPGGPYHIDLTTSEVPASINSVLNDRLRVGLKYEHLLTREGKDQLAADLSKRGGSNVPLDSLSDVLYNARVKFGTPAQEIGLLIDTGSPTLWAFGTNCTGTCGPQSFDNTKSSTFKATGETFELNYGSGHLEGGFGKDVVNLGGLQAEAKFGLGWTASDFEAMKDKSSGIIGLSFGDGESQYTPIWLDQIQNNKWADKQFGVYLNRAPAGSTRPQAGGKLTLAGVDSSLYSGDINYVNLGDGGLRFNFAWIVPVQSLTVKGQTINLSQNQAIIDTGTTLVYGPAEQVREVYKNIPGAEELSGQNAGVFLVPCDLKDVGVALTFNGVKYPIKDSDLVIPTETPDTCIGGIGFLPGLGVGDNWLVGAVFLKNVYSAYRYEPKSVGFAKLK